MLAISKDLVWESFRFSSRKCEPIADAIIEIIKKETEILNCSRFNLHIYGKNNTLAKKNWKKYWLLDVVSHQPVWLITCTIIAC